MINKTLTHLIIAAALLTSACSASKPSDVPQSNETIPGSGGIPARNYPVVAKYLNNRPIWCHNMGITSGAECAVRHLGFFIVELDMYYGIDTSFMLNPEWCGGPAYECQDYYRMEDEVKLRKGIK